MSLKRSYKGIPAGDIKLFLEEKYLQYNNPSFITDDPVSIPHCFSDRRDREISGFLTAAIAWGRRDLILRSSRVMLELLDNTPYEFIVSAGDEDISRLKRFVHRTFNGDDFICFINGLRNIYSNYPSMEEVLLEGMNGGSVKEGLSHLRSVFFSLPHEKRSEKHFADVMGGAAGKRLNMFLRWMIRRDNHGVDFGMWDKIDPSVLYIPLDLHSGNTARRLGLLSRKTNDWKAVEELTEVLRTFDPDDPVKYDFALFGLGVNEKI
ncbi:MAG TPA: TIGR02757 family protein [Bacteroidales bacterium]|nr:TIGR02757 family protein [Bacteroidales bacterium]